MYCKDEILLCGTFSGIYLYDLKNSGFIEDKVLDSFIKENKLSVEWTGGGYTNFTFLGEDHAVYIAGETGLYRHVIGGSTIEQIIDGSLSSEFYVMVQKRIVPLPFHGKTAIQNIPEYILCTVHNLHTFFSVYSDFRKM